ncbi:uncharacterized protein LOC120574852 isoform X2 [Perca fluviatilis]|uniref:uncharacterized protein LOC120574852 isoform X2 n=1 Tax=Perca fluviatilis TaxID=8168 RepID=UPI0019638E2E|nr:uncharacterized protein LOC120574852 isoform X2 [Perca fluviatilis]
MYFKIILILSGAVFIHAQRSHELCQSFGCFDSSDTQLTVTHDGEEIYYADFKKGLVVWNSKIPTTVHVPHAYKIALHYRMVCRGELARYKPDKSATTKTKGDIYGCTVEHASLEKPQTKFWEADINQTNISPAVFCGLGLFLGLLGVAAGTFFFVKGKCIS